MAERKPYLPMMAEMTSEVIASSSYSVSEAKGILTDFGPQAIISEVKLRLLSKNVRGATVRGAELDASSCSK